MNRAFRLVAVAALLSIAGGVLLLSVVFVVGHYALQGVAYLPRSVATLPWAILTVAAVAGAGRSLMLLLDWINSEVPPWVTDQPRRARRIAAIGTVAWLAVAVAFICGGYIGDGGWHGDVGLPAAVSAVCIGVAATLHRVRRRLHR